jgi:DNA-binding CsgD family transcriptional regulator
MPGERPPVVAYAAAAGSEDPLLRLAAHALRATVAVAPATAAAFVRVSRRGTAEHAVSLEAAHADPAFVDACARRLAEPRSTRASPVDAQGDTVTMTLRSAGIVVAAIVLAREHPWFGPDETTALRRIQPLIEQAYLCAVEPRGQSVRETLRGRGLTPRQADVAELAGRGATNAEIARSLHVSEATVKTHMSRVFEKAGVPSRTRLALLLGGRADD